MSSINNLDENASLAMCISAWHVPSMVFKTVLDLNVFGIIHDAGPSAQLSTVDIIAKLPTNNNPNATVVLDRLLRLLASFDILTFSARDGLDGGVERLYGLGPVCKFFLRNDDEGSFASNALLNHDNIALDTWKHLKDAVLEGGIAFNKAHGMSIFEYLNTDSRYNKIYYDAMNHSSTLVVKEILENYKGFEGITSLVDVGGATGVTLNMIIKMYPYVKGICFDLPHVIKDALSFPGIEKVGGDMYISIPSADAIFMKSTLSIGDDEKCVKVLKNCHKALPKEGKVIICEKIVPELPENSPSAHNSFILDAIMLAFPGGRVRTQQEFEALGKLGGFQGFRVACHVCGTCVMEYLKMP